MAEWTEGGRRGKRKPNHQCQWAQLLEHRTLNTTTSTTTRHRVWKARLKQPACYRPIAPTPGALVCIWPRTGATGSRAHPCRQGCRTANRHTPQPPAQCAKAQHGLPLQRCPSQNERHEASPSLINLYGPKMKRRRTSEAQQLRWKKDPLLLGSCFNESPVSAIREKQWSQKYRPRKDSVRIDKYLSIFIDVAQTLIGLEI